MGCSLSAGHALVIRRHHLHTPFAAATALPLPALPAHNRQSARLTNCIAVLAGERAAAAAGADGGRAAGGARASHRAERRAAGGGLGCAAKGRLPARRLQVSISNFCSLVSCHEVVESRDPLGVTGVWEPAGDWLGTGIRCTRPPTGASDTSEHAFRLTYLLCVKLWRCVQGCRAPSTDKRNPAKRLLFDARRAALPCSPSSLRAYSLL